MVEHPNSLLLHQCIQAVSDGDRQTLRSLWADDVVWHVKGESPWQGEIKGADDIFEYLADLGEVGNFGFHVEIEDVMVGSRRAAVLCRCDVQHQGRQLEARYLLVTTIVDRRVREIMSIPIEPERVAEFWTESAP